MIAYAPSETVMNPDLLGLANEYAEALLDSLTEGDPKQICEELKELASLTESIEGCRELFASATSNAHQRMKMVDRIFGPDTDGTSRISPAITSLLGVLARNNRLSLIAAVSDSFDALLKRRMNTIDITVRTAVPMSAGQIENLKKSFTVILNTTPQIHNVVDSKIIAGMVVQIGDTIYDSSAADQIDRILQDMKKES